MADFGQIRLSPDLVRRLMTIPHELAGASFTRPFRARRSGWRFPGLKPWAESSSPFGARPFVPGYYRAVPPGQTIRPSKRLTIILALMGFNPGDHQVWRFALKGSKRARSISPISFFKTETVFVHRFSRDRIEITKAEGF